MPDLSFIAPTKRKKMTKARAARIFLDNNGICINCGVQIRQGEEWFVEHPDSLAQGGSDNDEDLGPSHTRCKPAKDAADAKSKAKRDRIITQGWSGNSRGRQIPSRPFPKRTEKYSRAQGRIVQVNEGE